MAGNAGKLLAYAQKKAGEVGVKSQILNILGDYHRSTYRRDGSGYFIKVREDYMNSGAEGHIRHELQHIKDEERGRNPKEWSASLYEWFGISL